MPQPTANPAHAPSTGVITAASPGPSSATPTSGFRTLPPSRLGGSLALPSSSPGGAAHDLRPTFVKEAEVEVRHLRAPVVQPQMSRLLEVADNRRLHALARAQFVQLGPLSRRHRQDHPLLRLRDPDLRIRQS